MELQSILAELLDLAERLDIDVRHAFLGGDGGGLCTLRGKRVLFVDTGATVADQVAYTALALAQLDEVNQCYIIPEIRQLLDSYSS